MKVDSSNRPDCDSDGEVFVASSYGSKVQDCRKRPRQPQIQGNSWVLRGQIFIDQLHTNSDWMVAGPEGETETEDRITKLHSRLQGLFGAQFEILFGKLFGNVMFFVIFCNLINISDVGADSHDAVKIKTTPDGKNMFETQKNHLMGGSGKESIAIGENHHAWHEFLDLANKCLCLGWYL